MAAEVFEKVRVAGSDESGLEARGCFTETRAEGVERSGMLGVLGGKDRTGCLGEACAQVVCGPEGVGFVWTPAVCACSSSTSGNRVRVQSADRPPVRLPPAASDSQSAHAASRLVTVKASTPGARTELRRPTLGAWRICQVRLGKCGKPD